MSEFKTKTGKLNAYSFACGYVEKFQGEKYHCELYKDGGVYHVRFIPNGEKWLKWESFELLKDARKCYNQFVCLSKFAKEVKKGL